MESIEERVLTFTTKQLCLKREKVSLNSRLLHDLGMDGDDAIEFFEAFQKEFCVNLDPLGEDWHLHFGPEGFVPSLSGCNSIGALVLAMLWLIGFGIGHWFRLSQFWFIVLFLVLFGVWVFMLKGWPLLQEQEQEWTPISIQDLVDSVKAGKWVKPVQR